MRWTLARLVLSTLISVSLVVAMACSGGQTGEITTLTACHEALGEVSVDAPSEAGRSARAQHLVLTTHLDTEVVIEGGDGEATSLSVTLGLPGDPATLMGGEECVRPVLAVPARVGLRTEDGALDATLTGVLWLSDADAAVAEASIALSEVGGTLDLEALHPDVDPARARVHLLLESTPERLTGQLSLRPGDEDQAERMLASF